MAKEPTWKEAVARVLGESSQPLHYTAIAERIIELGLRKNLGATPASTVNAIIATSIKHDGNDTPYVRVAKGTFALAKQNPSLENSSEDLVAPDDDQEPQYAIVTSFGMFWQRASVEWGTNPRLLGMQQLGATPVDFQGQLGIYLLYDGREVIYIGRSADRPLGRRLYEHTRDRLAVRWDRFSWFGLRPVSEKAELGEIPVSFDSNKLIPALEAILIEALEPRQNRKRGDDLAAVEYIQKEDPQIAKKRLKASIDEALG